MAFEFKRFAIQGKLSNFNIAALFFQYKLGSWVLAMKLK